MTCIGDEMLLLFIGFRNWTHSAAGQQHGDKENCDGSAERNQKTVAKKLAHRGEVSGAIQKDVDGLSVGVYSSAEFIIAGITAGFSGGGKRLSQRNCIRGGNGRDLSGIYRYRFPVLI